MAPGIYDRDNDPDCDCRRSSNTARCRKDRRPGVDPRIRRARENLLACGMEKNFVIGMRLKLVKGMWNVEPRQFENFH